MYFHIIQKWNQQQTAPPQFTKALLHLYSCYFVIIIKILCICIFHEKREKSSLMIVIEKYGILPKYLKLYLFDSMYKRKIYGHTFSSTFYVFQMILRLICVSPYTYWALENSSISNESSCTYLKQSRWLWNLHAHSKPHVSF